MYSFIMIMMLLQATPVVSDSSFIVVCKMEVVSNGVKIHPVDSTGSVIKGKPITVVYPNGRDVRRLKELFGRGDVMDYFKLCDFLQDATVSFKGDGKDWMILSVIGGQVTWISWQDTWNRGVASMIGNSDRISAVMQEYTLIWEQYKTR